MKTEQEFINEINKRLVPVYNPLEIYVYGEKDWFCNEDPEDIEITVVIESSPSKRRLDRSFFGNEALDNLGIGTFLFVYTKDEFAERSTWSGASAAYYAKKYGTKIYERS